MSSPPRQTIPPYWRSLQELTGSPEFRRQLEAEFPGEFAPGTGGDASTTGGFSRRRFLQLMSASIAMAGLTGCRWPQEKIVPFASRPEGYIPGETKQFATTLAVAGSALGALVTSYDGRPIKVEGNPRHPQSLGGTNLFGQASILELYDPDRSQRVLRHASGQAVGATWDDFSRFATDHFATLASRRGGGLAVLTDGTPSIPLVELHGRFQQKFSRSHWFLHEAITRQNERAGSLLAFGQVYRSSYDLSEARVIVDFAADLLQSHPTALRNTRQFARGRTPRPDEMNRLYVFESGYSATGAMADHRIPTHPESFGPLVQGLAAELFLRRGLAVPAAAAGRLAELRPFLDGGPHRDTIGPLAADLLAHRHQSVLVPGPGLSPDLHWLCHVLNQALGNSGLTVRYFSPPGLPTDALGDIAELTGRMRAGEISTLVILGGNPVYDTGADLEFGNSLAKVQTTIHLGLFADETARACTWHLPRAHPLESWGIIPSHDGLPCGVQPLIEPLYGGKTAAELLSLLTDDTPRSGYEMARGSFHWLTGGRGEVPAESSRFEKSWHRFLHDGFLAERDPVPQEPALVAPTNLSLSRPSDDHPGLALVFAPDSKVFDGRFANNPWLQELPDLLTKLTWDNAAILGPTTAATHHLSDGDMVELQFEGRSLRMPVYILPGQAADTVTVNLGYGRTAAGRVGDGVGFDTYRLRPHGKPYGGSGLKITRTGQTHELALTQDHHAIDTRGAAEREARILPLIRQADLHHYQEHPDFAKHMGVHHPPLISLWREKDYSSGHRWSMVIDLNVCTGCNACVTACQAENNIPVVGKDQVANGREMHWLRLDRYFSGDPADPQVSHQPVACVHCENAPCEQVCPVAATVHSDEGLNVMVYNRCVGTRYCSNNCPYKVRRFNFFNYRKNLTQTEMMAQNPEVSIRSRGVMEKCTYCVQRIEAGKIKAKNERRPLRDGEIVPACAQSCPAEAIKFGDLNDPESRVAALQKDPRAYQILAELNVKPRTTYLARVRNPNPDLTAATGDHRAPGDHDQTGDHTDHSHTERP